MRFHTYYHGYDFAGSFSGSGHIVPPITIGNPLWRYVYIRKSGEYIIKTDCLHFVYCDMELDCKGHKRWMEEYSHT